MAQAQFQTMLTDVWAGRLTDTVKDLEITIDVPGHALYGGKVISAYMNKQLLWPSGSAYLCLHYISVASFSFSFFRMSCLGEYLFDLM